MSAIILFRITPVNPGKPLVVGKKRSGSREDFLRGFVLGGSGAGHVGPALDVVVALHPGALPVSELSALGKNFADQEEASWVLRAGLSLQKRVAL